MLETEEAVAPVNLANYHHVFKASYIEQSEAKRVIIKPKRLEYSAESLAVR